MKWDTHTFTAILLLIVGLWEFARGYNLKQDKPDQKMAIRSYFTTGAVVLIFGIYYLIKNWS